MRSRILFHLEWHMATYSGWSIVSGCLIFFPSLLACNVHHCPLCFLLFNSNPHSIISYFVSISFIEVLILLNLVLQLQFLFGFSISPYFLKFLILSSTLMLKFFSFNFIIRSNFMLFYFF